MSDYFDRVERQIVRRVETGIPRSTRIPVTSGYLGVAAAVLVVIVVAGVFLAARVSGGGAPSPAAPPAVRVAFTTSSADSTAIDQSVKLLRERLHATLPEAQVARTPDGLTVTLAHRVPGARDRILALAAPGRIAFYDWEADVIAANDKAIASQMLTQDPGALEISQGKGLAAPGEAGAGSLSLRQARALLARDAGRGEFVLMRAIDSEARFYVLKGTPALTNADVVNPRASTDPSTHVPDVILGLTPSGRRAFQALTATVAARGDRVSGLGETLNQHFAVALDNRLVTVPFVDFKQYPDGVDASDGVGLSDNFTAQSARDMAALLRYGPLPVSLTAAG